MSSIPCSHSGVRGTRVGIPGSRLKGGKLGTTFARAGHGATFIHERDERTPKPSVRSTWDKVQYGTLHEAGQEAAAVCAKQGAEAGAMLGEFSERWLTKCVGRRARRSPAAGVGRDLKFVAIGCKRS